MGQACAQCPGSSCGPEAEPPPLRDTSSPVGRGRFAHRPIEAQPRSRRGLPGFGRLRLGEAPGEAAGSGGRSPGAGARDDRKLKSREKHLTPGEPGRCPQGRRRAGDTPAAGPPPPGGAAGLRAAGDEGSPVAETVHARKVRPQGACSGRACVTAAFLSPIPGTRAPATPVSPKPTRLCLYSSKALHPPGPLEAQFRALRTPGEAGKASR